MEDALEFSFEPYDVSVLFDLDDVTVAANDAVWDQGDGENIYPAIWHHG